MTHTQGKWYVTGTNPPRIYSHDGMSIIAQCDSAGEMTREQEKSNALLISAAPDLLNMLQRLLDETSGGGVPCLLTLEHARAAINKAKGE